MSSVLDVYLTKGVHSQEFYDRFFHNHIREMRILNNNVCNFKCSHCFYGFKTGEELAQKLSIVQWKEVLHEAVSLGITNFHFSGKEPLMTMNIWNLIDELKIIKKTNPDVTWDIVTNGSMLSKPYIQERLETSGFSRVCLSVDDVDNPSMRSRNTVYDALEILTESKVSPTCFVDCHKGNKDKIKHIVLDLYKSGVLDFYVRPVYPFGNAKDSELMLTPLEYADCVQQVLDVFMFKLLVDIEFQMWSPMFLEMRSCNIPFAKKLWEKFLHKDSWDLSFGRFNFIVDFFYPSFLDQITVTTDGYVLGIGLEVARKQYSELSPGRVLEKPLLDLIASGKQQVIKYLRSNGDHDKPEKYIFQNFS